jgi:hypothetical protein
MIFTMEVKMNKEKAKKYLKRKGKPITKEEVEKVMKEGKIYGDPIVALRY